MKEERSVTFAIVDYGLGNLFSIKHACEHTGIRTMITSSSSEIRGADALILPGVGAFGDAVASLRRLKLIDVLCEFAESGKILFGICLGMQLLMTESLEFGRHSGLNLIKGRVVPFEHPTSDSGGSLKVPQIGWNRISPHGSAGKTTVSGGAWNGSPLEGLQRGEYMYFIHSFYVVPEDDVVSLSNSQYGDIQFCSSLLHNNIFACQFHPERSGPQGLQIYRNLRSLAVQQTEKRET
jgi:glutamine amidotransferase